MNKIIREGLLRLLPTLESNLKAMKLERETKNQERERERPFCRLMAHHVVIV